MYIAFKWLVSMALVMWLLLCFADLYRRHKNNDISDCDVVNDFISSYKNTTQRRLTSKFKRQNAKLQNSYQRESVLLFYNIIFFTGAVALIIYNNKKNVILNTEHLLKNNLLTPYLMDIKRSIQAIPIKTIIEYAVVAALNIPQILRVFCYKVCRQINFRRSHSQSVLKDKKLNLFLIANIKSLVEQRKSLGCLLSAAIKENKNIRLKYQLETMAKNRLEQHVEESRKEIKKNRHQFVSFQHMYMVTKQENIFLKYLVKKIRNEKDNIEKNLFGLINQVCLSKNKDLKAYCSHIIVKKPKDLLNLNVKAEINAFLEKSHRSVCNTPNIDSDLSNIPSGSSYQYDKIGQILETDVNLVSLVKGAPKLRGLPGEYVWTVKDKNGLIEKLYEYEYEIDMDNVDTIRRIREYSVYYDKDCLLDSRSLQDASYVTTIKPEASNNTNYVIKCNNFLTGSQEFKAFLRNNKKILPISKTHV